jgi:plastocyanin
MRDSVKRFLAVAVVATWTAPVARAQPAAATAADYSRLAADLARVQQEVREQRQLILQMMEMHSALLRYLQSSGAAGFPPGSAGLGLPPTGAAGALPSAGSGAAPAGGAVSGGAPAIAAPARDGTVTGSVRAKDGALGEVYVYVDGLRGGPAHPPAIEIKQVDRRFSPAVAVVPLNTPVSFPNADKVFHNVFSPTPGAAFDLGTVKAGEKSSPTVLAKPGHVEVFCNIHSRMRADILVVPNSHWTRVHPDGTFQLRGVPLGSYRLVMWGPTLKPVAQRIEVTGAGGAVATFTAEAAGAARHLNKNGAAYGSYED